LVFYAVKNNKPDDQLSIFVKNGSQIDLWKQANVRLGPNDINADFSIAVEATTNGHPEGELFVI
jgi:hypothetical protein